MNYILQGWHKLKGSWYRLEYTTNNLSPKGTTRYNVVGGTSNTTRTEKYMISLVVRDMGNMAGWNTLKKVESKTTMRK